MKDDTKVNRYMRYVGSFAYKCSIRNCIFLFLWTSFALVITWDADYYEPAGRGMSGKYLFMMNENKQYII